MKATEREELTAYLVRALSYWKADVSEFTIQVWISACEQYSLEQVKKAIVHHATDPERGQFAPKVADITRLLVGTKTDRSLIAWSKAYEAAQRIGAYTDVAFDDPAIHAAIADCGGWVKFCRTDSDELSYLQHRFCNSYKAWADRGEFDYPRFLNGDRSPDSMYQKRGLEPPKPKLIGNPKNAEKVLALQGKTSRASA